MAEYISKAALKAAILKRLGISGEQYLTHSEKLLVDVINKMPPADVVEVVRCKDCYKHTQSALCEGWSRYGTVRTPDDGYCSYGVKRDG